MRQPEDGAKTHRRMYCNAICIIGALNVGLDKDN
jgi:hypothetical protein